MSVDQDADRGAGLRGNARSTVRPPISAPTTAPPMSPPIAAPSPFRIWTRKPRTPSTAAETPSASSTVRVSGSYAGGDLVAERGPAAMGQVQGEHDADDDARHGGDHERRPDPAGLDVEGEQHEHEGDVGEQQEPEQHAPADRAEEPLAEEQHAADQEQEPGDDQDRRWPRRSSATIRLTSSTMSPISAFAEVDVGAEAAASRPRTSRRAGRAGPAARPNRAGRRRRLAPGLIDDASSATAPPSVCGTASMVPAGSHAPTSGGALGASRRLAARYPRRDGTAPHGRAAVDRDRAHGRRDARHECGRPRPRADRRGRRRRPDHGAAGRPRGGHAQRSAMRSRAPTSSSPPAASGRRRTTSRARRSPRTSARRRPSTPTLEAWLRELFERRNLPFPEANRKQAWLIPSATAIPNDERHGAGLVGRAPDGRIVVALPGPPREMRPMWDGWVLPRLAERGLGRPIASVTLRLTGIGESAIAARLGSLLDAGRAAVRRDVRARRRRRRPDLDARRERRTRAVAAAEALVAERRGAGHRRARGARLGARRADLAGAAGRAPRRARLAAVGASRSGSAARCSALLGEGLAERLAFGETLPQPAEPRRPAGDARGARRARPRGRRDRGRASRSRRASAAATRPSPSRS